MGTRTSYEPGTPSWTDLTTPDQAAAKQFYTAVFGWTADDRPIGPDAIYSMMQLDGRGVAAISPQPEQQREAGIPPMWNTYITVSSADEALERARTLGATVHAPAFDVLQAGRMGVVQDPQGAFFEVWEPRENPGAELVNSPGALSWNELATPDPEASAQFYGQLFGWSHQRMEESPDPYWVLTGAHGRTVGAMRPAARSEPPYWLVYFGCEDVEQTVARVSEHGGRTLAGPLDIGPGRFAAVSDPQGAVFALYCGRFED